MIKKFSFIALFFCFFFVSSFSQEIRLSSIIIPDSLKTNANAVVREDLLEITVKSSDKQLVNRRYIVTVLNKKGNKNVRHFEHYDDDTRIKKLSLKVYDALGNEIKKYSKSKFIDVSAVDGGTLYSDARVKFVDYTPISYPYTVVFESEVENSSTGFISKWFPVKNYHISVEKSSYKVNNPQGVSFRKKQNKFEDYSIKNLSTDTYVHYELKNAVAQKQEQSSPLFSEIMPSLFIALDDFSLKGVKGHATNWQEFGRWMYQKLLDGRSVLSPETIQTVKNLVKDAKSDIEKAKIVYDFMQNRTRYISVQVGIGGWEPIAASEVHQAGYGDCKGLTNYTKALLDAVGVESYYTVVFAGSKKNIDKDFTSLQGNHVILNLPNNGNDIWLECTSQTVPFGFLGGFTHDRNVLVVTPQGGIIKKTIAYKDEGNFQQTKAKIILGTTGNVVAEVERISKGIQYDDKYHLETKNTQELKNYYKSEVWNYNAIDLESILLKNDKENVVFTEKIKARINNYASVIGNEILLRLNVFNKYNYIPKRYRKRKQSFKVLKGFLDVDEFTIKIPEGYTITSLPPDKEVDTKFGTYKISAKKVNESTLLYKKYFLLKSGAYPKEEYKKYRKFLKTVSKLENLRISLSKK